MLKVKLTVAQLSALECNGIFEDLEDRYLPGIINGHWLIFAEDARERIAEIANDISNSEDAAAEDRANDRQTRKFSRLASGAAARLFGKVLRAS